VPPDQVLVLPVMVLVMVGRVLTEVTHEVVSALTVDPAVRRKERAKDLKVCILKRVKGQY
jgi:hypothetical protein